MRLLFTLILTISFLPGSAQLPDSVVSRLGTLKGEEKIIYLTDVCWEFSMRYPELSVEAGQMALRLAEASGDSVLVARALNDLGAPYYRQGKYEQTLRLWNRALEIRLEKGNPRDLAALQSKIAVVYQELGHFEKALRGHLEAVRIFEQISDSAAMAHSYNNITNTLKGLQEYEKAAGYAHKANEIFTRLGNKYGMAITLGNMGLGPEMAGSYDSVISYNLRALGLFRELGLKQEEATTLNNIGHYHRKTGDLKAANDYFFQAYETIKETNPASAAHYLVNHASALSEMGRSKESIEIFRIALGMAEQEQTLPVMAAGYEGLSEAYARSGEYRNALEAKEKEAEIRASILSGEKTRQIAEMQTRYETEKKEKEIALLNQENKIRNLKLSEQEARIAKKNLLIASLGGASLLLMLSGGLGYAWYRQRQKRIMDKKLLEEQKNRLRAVVEAQEAERSRISRDLHDGVGQLLAAARMNYSRLGSDLPGLIGNHLETYETSNRILDEACSELRAISHQMLPRVLRESGLTEAIADLLEKTFGRSGIRWHFDHKVSGARLMPGSEIAVYRIVQELIANIAKHAGAREISVQLIERNNRLTLLVEDDGKGIDPKTAGKGAGMNNIRSRAEALGGNFRIEKAGEKGTLATLRIDNIESILTVESVTEESNHQP